MFKFRKATLVLISVFLLIVCFVVPAWAVEVKSGNIVTIPEGNIQKASLLMPMWTEMFGQPAKQLPSTER